MGKRMALQFVLGGSGSGKSTCVFDKIIERSMQEENRNFFILVPDQFTMQTQMEFASRHPRGGILNIDILSFSRLSHRILQETGGNREPVLDDTGKSLVLRKVAEELKEEIPVLGGNLKKLGYIHEVKSAISEFMQYGIDEKEMEKMLKFAEKRGGLHGKLKDLGVLYQGFSRYIRDKFITTEETYDRLACQLEKSALIRNSVIVLDGFTGFTPIQNRVVEKLLTLSDELIMTVTLDKKGAEAKECDEQQLFSLSKKTIKSMEKLAKDNKVEIMPSIWMEEGAKRFKESPQLEHLEKNLFRYPYEQRKDNAGEIRIWEADTMESEVKNICHEIRKLLEEGYCYRDIAVIAGDLGSYSSLIEEIFEEYEIPVFMDQTRKITLNPFIEYIRSAVQIHVKQFSYEAMFHYLRSGMANVDRETVDKLENYCLAYGVKGKRAWSALFCSSKDDGKNLSDYSKKQKEKRQQELDELNNAREKIMTGLLLLKSGKQKVKKQAEQLYQFLTANESQKKLKEYEEYFKAVGDRAKEKEYAQIYRLVMELLEQIVNLLGEEELTWEEFGQILDAGFGEIQVGIIPQEVDMVVAGDMERTRLKQVRALFFLGINDGKIPKQSGNGGILSDIDREFLAEGDFELAPTPRQQMFIQKFYLYLNVTKPSHKLYLSYAKVNAEGKSMKPSYFTGSIQKLYPGLKTEPAEEMRWDRLLTKAEGRTYGAGLLEQYKRGELDKRGEDVLIALLKVLREEKIQQPWVEDILDSTFYAYENTKISKEAARILYGTVIHSSVSRLEKMAACAYAHFLQYGLGLKEREEYRFEAVDMGIVFHKILEIFAGKLAQMNYTWIDFPLEEGREILKNALENYAVSYGNTILYATARNAYAIEKMERILWRTVTTLRYQLQKGKFLPKNYEISFSALEDLDSVRISLNEDEKMYLRGRIDRLDTYEEENNLYVKVVDYKSGEQQFQLAAFYYGLQLQLVVYLNAAMELQKKQNPARNVLPAAFLYYHVNDPMVEGKEGISEEEVEQMIKRQLRVSGIVNSEPAVLQGLDKTHEEKSDVIPVEYKKDGSLSSRSSVMSQEEIETLQKFARQKVEDLGKEIAQGNITVNPTVFKDRDACTFCQYKAVCSFDPRLEGYEKKELKDPGEEEIWKEIRTAVEKNSSAMSSQQKDELLQV